MQKQRCSKINISNLNLDVIQHQKAKDKMEVINNAHINASSHLFKPV